MRKQAKIMREVTPYHALHTPPEVLKAIDTIAFYLRRGGWVEVTISDGGGAVFHLTSTFDVIAELENELYEAKGK